MSTGESIDSAALHLGPLYDEGRPIPFEAEPHPSAEEQLQAHVDAYEPPDTSDWVTCLPECQWADDGSAPDSGRSTPPAVHADACPHAASRYVQHLPAPPR